MAGRIAGISRMVGRATSRAGSGGRCRARGECRAGGGVGGGQDPKVNGRKKVGLELDGVQELVDGWQGLDHGRGWR